MKNLLGKKALTKIQGIIIAGIIIVAALATAGYWFSLYNVSPPVEVKSELIYEWNGDIVTCDPQVGWSATTQQIARAAYETLLRLKGDTLELESCLATKWESSTDGLGYTFDLREGVEFTDGTLCDARAVKKSFERLFGIGQQTSFYKAITDIVVLSTYRIKFVLARAYAPFLYALSLTTASIVNPTAVDTYKTVADVWAMNYFQSHTNGTGPYMLQEWKKGSSWTLVQNPNYWRGWAGQHLSKITGLIVTERATTIMMLQKGEIDLSSHIPRDQISVLDADPNLKAVEYNALSTFFLALNNQKPPLDDVHVRRALSYALDYEQALAFIENRGQQARGPLHSKIPGWSNETYQYSYDMEKAQEELSQSEHPNGGFTLDLIWCSGNDDQRKVAVMLKSSLEQLNIGLNIEEKTWPALTAAMTNPQTARHIVCEYEFVSMPHPDATMYKFFHSSAIPLQNWEYYNNTEVDSLLVEGRVTIDPGESAAIYQEACEIVTEEAACIFVWEETRTEMMGEWVHGFVPNPAMVQQYRFYDMYVVAEEKP